MKKLTFPLFVMMVMMMSSCEVIGGIFKAGVWTGIIIVALVIALIIWLISRGTRRD